MRAFVAVLCLISSIAFGMDGFTRGSVVDVVPVFACQTAEQGTSLLQALQTGNDAVFYRVFGNLQRQRDSAGRGMCEFHQKAQTVRIVEKVTEMDVPNPQSQQGFSTMYLIRVFSHTDGQERYILAKFPVIEPGRPERPPVPLVPPGSKFI